MQSWDTIGPILKKRMKHLKQNWEIFFPHKKVLQLLAELYFFSKLTHKKLNWQIIEDESHFLSKLPFHCKLWISFDDGKNFSGVLREIRQTWRDIEWKKYQMMQTIIANFSQPSTFCLGKFFQCRIKSNIKSQNKIIKLLNN